MNFAQQGLWLHLLITATSRMVYGGNLRIQHQSFLTLEGKELSDSASLLKLQQNFTTSPERAPHANNLVAEMKEIAKNIAEKKHQLIETRQHEAKLAKERARELEREQHAMKMRHDQQAMACNAGNTYTQCLDVEACAAQGPAEGKYAFVLTFVGLMHQRLAPLERRRLFLPYIETMAKQAQEKNIDVLLLMPKGEEALLSDEQQRIIKENKVQVVLADWSIPPHMKFVKQHHWCGQQDLVRLHALGLDQYDAIAYYDTDIALQGDVTPALRCAATGKFLTTSGPMSPMNLGFFAVKPDKRLMHAAAAFAETAPFNTTSGWAEAGYGVRKSHFPGAECGQGFFHTLFFMQENPVVDAALTRAGFSQDAPLSAAMLDPCVWNYQGQGLVNPCKDDFRCDHVLAHHKPPQSESDAHSCNKTTIVAVYETEYHPSAMELFHLPVSTHMPEWLESDDLLAASNDVKQPRILLAHTVLKSSYIHEWGDMVDGKVQRPAWLRACLATNQAFAKAHQHPMVIRWKPSLPTPPYFLEQCSAAQNQETKEACEKQNERENFNWEKEQMMLDYLNSDQNFSHVLVMDADAALVAHNRDTLKQMANELEVGGKDLLLTNEDWLNNGHDRINGGLLFAKNTPFTKALFADMLDAHYIKSIDRPRIGGGPLHCESNEQLCFNSLKGRPQFSEKTLILSGMRYNRGGCVLTHCGSAGGISDPGMTERGIADPDLDVIHFMGGSKTAAAQALCQHIPELVKQGSESYGCAP